MYLSAAQPDRDRALAASGVGAGARIIQAITDTGSVWITAGVNLITGLIRGDSPEQMAESAGIQAGSYGAQYGAQAAAQAANLPGSIVAAPIGPAIGAITAGLMAQTGSARKDASAAGKAAIAAAPIAAWGVVLGPVGALLAGAVAYVAQTFLHAEDATFPPGYVAVDGEPYGGKSAAINTKTGAILVWYGGSRYDWSEQTKAGHRVTPQQLLDAGIPSYLYESTRPSDAVAPLITGTEGKVAGQVVSLPWQTPEAQLASSASLRGPTIEVPIFANHPDGPTVTLPGPGSYIEHEGGKGD